MEKSCINIIIIKRSYTFFYYKKLHKILKIKVDYKNGIFLLRNMILYYQII